jgi:hypothetical protein
MRPAVVRLAVAALAIAVPLAIAVAQAPAAAVALVLEVSGGQIAGIEPYREIAAGTTVTVPAGVRLVVQHYASCRKFVLAGGTAAFRPDGVSVSASQSSETKVACPRKVALKGDGASAAVVMRSIGGPRVAIATRPDFVLVGPRASEFAMLRVKRGPDVVLEQPLAAGSAVRWPATTASLAPATPYEIELVPATAGRAPLVVGVRTLEAPAPDDTLTLLSAE